MTPNAVMIRAAIANLEVELQGGVPADRELALHRELAELYEALRQRTDAIGHLEACKTGGCKDLPLLRKLVELYRHTGNHQAANDVTNELAQQLRLPAWVVSTALAFSHLNDERGGLGGLISSLAVNVVAGLVVALLGWMVWSIIQQFGVTSQSIAACIGIIAVALWFVSLRPPSGSMWIPALLRLIAAPPAGVAVPFLLLLLAAYFHLFNPFPPPNPCEKYRLKVESAGINQKRLAEQLASKDETERKSPYRKVDVFGSGTSSLGTSESLWLVDTAVGQAGFWLYDQISFTSPDKWYGMVTLDPSVAHYIYIVHIDNRASAFMKIHEFISSKDVYPGYPTPFPEGITVCASQYHEPGSIL